ncbi:HD domain-containing protein [uncultured Desulfobulbus sp.]|uniref:HD domain-containing protein n=1 Tax=uncultured Desulfobulbus sp. TaxID=239745 RepID=UPI0029C6B90B|nr:HD domain-containing protein [uncultured Desulfobulbus sp.]
MLGIWPMVILGGALVLVGVAGVLVLRSEEQEPSLLEQMTLSALSQRWVRPKTSTRIEGVKHISELAHLWRNEQVIAEGIEKVELVHPRSRSFAGQLRTWSFFNQAPGQRAVCLEIVRLLDREGQCPSVVDVQGDVEAAWEQNTYRILAKTTLLDHSLNVAQQVVKLLSDHQAWHVIPDTMVAALGHDLGKLKSARGSLYALGEHPLAAGAIVSALPGFKELSRKEDILRAIKLHHKLPEGLLGKTLKKADQQARQQELERWVEVKATEEIKESHEEAATEKPTHPSTREAVQRVQADIYGETIDPAPSREEVAPPQRMDISAWFDAAGYLAMLKPYINRVEGRRFLAFTMADGLVYFQVKALEEVARKQAQEAGCMEIATMAQDDPTMRQVLFTVVQHLRQEHEVIATGLIKAAYFGGYFMVTRKHSKEMRGYYTPFHAEAFGSIAEMERAKPDLLRDILKVSPHTGSDQVS